MIERYTRWSSDKPACARTDGTVRYSEHTVAMLLAMSRHAPGQDAGQIMANYCKRDNLTLSAGTAWVFEQALRVRRAKEAA